MTSWCRYFYPRPPRGGRPARTERRAQRRPEFLSTPSARRATWPGKKAVPRRHISIHALREEGDRKILAGKHRAVYFYPRPPRGGRRLFGSSSSYFLSFLSTPSARRATGLRRKLGAFDLISIHALREEGDQGLPRREPQPQDFYPRPPRGGRRDHRGGGAMTGLFLSTPSARRATAKTETKSLFSYKLYNILHEFRRALIYNGSKNYPNHAK